MRVSGVPEHEGTHSPAGRIAQLYPSSSESSASPLQEPIFAECARLSIVPDNSEMSGSLLGTPLD